MAFVSVPPFFCNIVYNLSHLVFYTELNARLPIVLYIEDDNRLIFLTEIKNVGKPETDIDV
jgi:hypothetical protein